MKSIKVAFYDLKYTTRPKKQSQHNLPFYAFEQLLADLSSKLDGNQNQQIIDTTNAGLETSIWFDCFDQKQYFNFKKECYYFLLAKDVSSLMVEDKRNKKLAQQDFSDNDIHLKIPAHFVYFPKRKILGVEEINNGPTKAIIEKAIKEKTKENIRFSPTKRNSYEVLERLKAFVDAIESVEFDFKDFSELIKDIPADECIRFMRENQSQLIIKTYLDSSDNKKKLLGFFDRLLNYRHKIPEREVLNSVANMSIKYKNEALQAEVMSLMENFLVFKKDREVYLEEFQNMDDNIARRLKYSKSIYQAIIDFYDEYFQD